MNPKLTRSRSNRILGGVCAGLGSYLGIDPTVVRLLFVVLALADGIAVLIYIVLWIMVPQRAGYSSCAAWGSVG